MTSASYLKDLHARIRELLSTPRHIGFMDVQELLDEIEDVEAQLPETASQVLRHAKLQLQEAQMYIPCSCCYMLGLHLTRYFRPRRFAEFENEEQD